MKRLKRSVLVCYLFLILETGRTFDIIGINKQMLYEYVGSVSVGAKAPQDGDNPAPPSSGWVVKGKLTVQRQNEDTLAAALAIDEISLNNSGEKFQQNKEMYPPYKPFKISLTPQGTISHLLFKEGDPIWSTNFKRAIASTLQFQVDAEGAFVVEETGIHGKCSTEYYIANRTKSITIRKTPELKTCTPFREAIHLTRSNVPPNLCEFDFQRNVIVGNEAQYSLLPHTETEYFLNTVHVKGTTLIHTFESTGEAQYINSELVLNFLNESIIDNTIDIETSMSTSQATLEFLALDMNDPTGGRHPQQQNKLMAMCADLLNSLAEGLENKNIQFGEPYDSTVSDIISLMTQMDFESLQKIFEDVDIGTSYRQETIRNIFFEIIPRIGTKASVRLIRDLVVHKRVKPTTAVQLLISLPFHIYELSHQLVVECETFMTLGPDRPDVRQAAVLSFATLIHNVFVAGKMSKDTFEEYVQKYFNLYLNGYDYEQKMLYLQALSNLQLGNVANYLDPIIKGEKDVEDEDIKFLAAWATMPLAHTRPQKIYELYWPIFESRNSSLEMRVAALTLLLISNPTPARLISLHRIIQDETCPHLINFYRTTIKSISETTYPCYQDLRRMLSYMHRHLPPAPESRYWVTGNYIFDYRDSKFGIGAMLQAFLVGDPKSDLPIVAYFKFDTEALGKFTGQLALYIKARGLPDAFLDRINKFNSENIKFELSKFLESMKAPLIPYTPLHLEFIVQMEGKTVLSYYLNQKTFHNLTYGDLIQRLNFLIRTDSHINMQTVRWPFMTKYAVPTVLGTSADVLLQTTVLTSLRGNITQHQALDGITRNHEIDVRYASYASCRSKSYNPFLNLEHEVNREQGFLLYMPINNELSINITNKCLKFSFVRPANLTSGLAFKSRSVTSTKGYITKSSPIPFNEVISPEKIHDVFQLFKYDIEDLGISVSVNTNLNELNTYRIMLLKSEFMENGFSKNWIINALMYLFGVAQLSSIHIGNDRNFTLLVHNSDFAKIEGSLGIMETAEVSEEKTGHKMDFSLVHTNEDSNVTLHKWNLIFDFSKSVKNNLYNVIGIVKRSNHWEEQDWKACIEMIYSPLVFMKKPHTVNGKLIFGKSFGDRKCPAEESRLTLSATAGPAENAEEVFNSTEILSNNLCPKEVLKFNPIPSSKHCNRESFESLTAITNYNAEMKFKNMPEWFDVWSNRLDHFVSAFSSKKVDHLNLGTDMGLSVQTPSDKFWVSLDLNGVKWNFYRIPFIPKLDSKYDTTEQFLYNTGLKRSCSLIHNSVNTFDDHTVDLLAHMNPNNRSCGVLLVADCSAESQLAVFLAPIVRGDNLTFSLRVHVGKNYFIFEPRRGLTDEQNIEFNGQERINIKAQPYQFPPFEKFYDFRVELNDHNILNIENRLIKANIQYDLSNIINVEIYGIYKSKMCGLCSLPLNEMENYNLCPGP